MGMQEEMMYSLYKSARTRVTGLEGLLQHLNGDEKVVCIIGLGYVGLPLALSYAEQGWNVIGIDIDRRKTEALGQGISYISHIESGRVQIAMQSGLLRASNDPSEVRDADGVIVCVPTPLGKHKEPDLSYVTETVETILPFLRPNQVLSLESTTYPGTTDEVVRPLIEQAGLCVGKDFFLVYSPEREDPGNGRFNTKTIPKVLGGCTEQCGKAGEALYKGVIEEVVTVKDCRTAEMTKLLENIHRAVNIGLVNELKPLAERMGIDIFEVIEAAATKPFGFVPYYPGPGLGGHCIPIDPFYLTWKAKEYGLNTRFIELAGEINEAMPDYVVSKVAEALNSIGKPISGSRILIIGLSYKKNIDDMRESPSVVLLDKLSKMKGDVQYHDPYHSLFPKMREYSFMLESLPVTEKVINEQDCIVLATDHDDIDYGLIYEHASLIIDTRGRYKPGGKVYRA